MFTLADREDTRHPPIRLRGPSTRSRKRPTIGVGCQHSPQRTGQPRHLPVKLGVRKRPLPARLVPEDDRLAVVAAAAKQVLGEVQPRADEPLRAGHAVVVGHDRVPRPSGDDAAERPYRRPELLGPVDRPSIQRAEIGQPGPPQLLDGPHEGGQVRRRDPLRRRFPERRGHGLAFVGGQLSVVRCQLSVASRLLVCRWAAVKQGFQPGVFLSHPATQGIQYHVTGPARMQTTSGSFFRVASAADRGQLTTDH
jgi:hypothetical protein